MLIHWQPSKEKPSVSYLPMRQKRPLNPAGHWQSKSFPSLMHWPPFLHGFGSHTETLETKSVGFKLFKSPVQLPVRILGSSLTAFAVRRLEGPLAFALKEGAGWGQDTFTVSTGATLTDSWAWNDNTHPNKEQFWFITSCMWHGSRSKHVLPTSFTFPPLKRLGAVAFEAFPAFFFTHTVVETRIRGASAWQIKSIPLTRF